jgi:hypothetical protein
VHGEGVESWIEADGLVVFLVEDLVAARPFVGWCVQITIDCVLYPGELVPLQDLLEVEIAGQVEPVALFRCHLSAPQ